MASLRRFARVALLIALAWSATPIPTQAPDASTNATADDALASLRPEVRLRKLHLVRPDLIPYPIAYEVCC
jgi:hypothetical protein